MGRKKKPGYRCSMRGCPNKRMPGKDLCHNHETIKNELHSYIYHKKEQEIKDKAKASRGNSKK